ncbi:DUF1214 domain-containing protein [Robertkochia flava]|uniref:DUF1214 domain-containing protein n=1 Tax=Robertkochia flava TaxID=3447986 RepID=UPI001CCFB287
MGANTGIKLKTQDGIEINNAAEKPKGVPEENWLPVSRVDGDIDIILRIYRPHQGRIKDYQPPVADKIK